MSSPHLDASQRDSPTVEPLRERNSSWQSFFRQTLAEAEAQCLKRHRTWHVQGGDHQEQLRERRWLINFGSNDYLGLRHDRRLARAIENALPTLGVGAGASPLVSGYSSALVLLEERLAAWQGTEAALVFSSGMAMNIGVISALAGREDLVLSDQLNHASLIDGCRLSGANKRIFPHADVAAARAVLAAERSRYRRALVITESVFSMDGDIGPLEELAEICRSHDAGLLVDEAHATGLYGASGAGFGEVLGATNDWLAKLGTLSKGIGTCGGFVAGSRELIDYLVNRCRTYIYSTGIAPPLVAATLAAIELMPELSERRERLQAISRRVRLALAEQGWRVPRGETPIVPVIVGSSERAVALSRQLLRAGLFVPAIRPPTVAADAARLRISLSAAHSDDQIERLLSALIPLA